MTIKTDQELAILDLANEIAKKRAEDDEAETLVEKAQMDSQ